MTTENCLDSLCCVLLLLVVDQVDPTPNRSSPHLSVVALLDSWQPTTTFQSLRQPDPRPGRPPPWVAFRRPWSASPRLPAYPQPTHRQSIPGLVADQTYRRACDDSWQQRTNYQTWSTMLGRWHDDEGQEGWELIVAYLVCILVPGTVRQPETQLSCAWRALDKSEVLTRKFLTIWNLERSIVFPFSVRFEKARRYESFFDIIHTYIWILLGMRMFIRVNGSRFQVLVPGGSGTLTHVSVFST